MNLLKEILRILNDGKAEDTIVLDIRDVNPSLCDFMVISSGYTSDHIIALADKLREELGGRYEGDKGCVWVVVDFGSVMVHIFTPEAREFYALEDLYSDANRIEIYAQDN